jgi:hypothetical protein
MRYEYLKYNDLAEIDDSEMQEFDKMLMHWLQWNNSGIDNGIIGAALYSIRRASCGNCLFPPEFYRKLAGKLAYLSFPVKDLVISCLNSIISGKKIMPPDFLPMLYRGTNIRDLKFETADICSLNCGLTGAGLKIIDILKQPHEY